MDRTFKKRISVLFLSFIVAISLMVAKDALGLPIDAGIGDGLEFRVNGRDKHFEILSSGQMNFFSDIDVVSIDSILIGNYATTTNSLVLTNKTLDSDLNTISNLTNTQVKVGANIDAAKLGTGFVSNTEFNLLDGLSASIVTTAATQELTNKKLTGGTASTSSQWVPPSDLKATLDTLCTSLDAGSLVFATDKNKYYLCDGVSLTELGGGGAGQGGINYITNFGAEEDLAGFQTYLDAVAGTPIDGIGGSPSGTLLRNVTTPLRSLADFQFTKAASSLGEGFSVDFAIDNADKAQVLSVSFDYDLSHANYDETYLRVYIYNKDSGAINEIVPRDIPTGKGTYSGYFQTTVDDDDYRLILHVSDNAATSYTGYFDNFRVGPQAVEIENPVISFRARSTLAQAFVNAGVVDFDATLHNTGQFNVAQNRFEATIDGYYKFTTSILIDSSPSPNNPYISLIKNGSEVARKYMSVLVGAPNSMTGTISAVIPLLKGENVAVQLTGDASFQLDNQQSRSFFTGHKIGSDSESSLGRIVYGYIGNSLPTSGISGAAAVVKFPALTEDSQGNYNSGTGNYTVTEKGTYDVHSQIELIASYVSGNDVLLSIRRNGATVHQAGLRQSTTKSRQQLAVTGLVDAVKGDVISIWASSAGAGVAWASSLGGNSFNIKKVEGGGGNASITSAVRMKYMSNDGQIMTNGIFTDVTYEVKIYDSHSAFNPATGVFTAPRKVNCSAHAQVSFSGASSWNVGELVSVNFSCTDCGRINLRPQEDDTYNIGTAAVNDHFELLKGQTVKFSVFQNSGLDVTLTNAKADNYFTLECK